MAIMVRTELTVEAGLVTYRLNFRDPIVTVGGDSSIH